MSDVVNPQSSVESKALTINLDKSRYGTFAEIGAGQEVARNFFKVGGAAGTIAKSMSAYDMKFSDEIYGKSDRYVSKGRLKAMLDHEYGLLLERLSAQRGDSTLFFVFADTVAARSFRGNNECHGWMGLRFQLEVNGPAHDIYVHVRMKDKENWQQGQAIGTFGVNLIYGGFYFTDDQDAFVKGLLDDLGSHRIEVDMLEWNGPSFMHLDNRLLSLKLVQNSLTNAVMFGESREILQPSEVLYKRPVLVQRGSFRPVTRLNVDMQESARKAFEPSLKPDSKAPIYLMEITLNNLLATGELEHVDFVGRAEALAELGYKVLISNYSEYYRLALYLRQYTKEQLGLVLGINSLLQMFQEHYYQHLEGGFLESLGKLFQHDTRLFIYPMLTKVYQKYIESVAGHHELPPAPSEELITLDNIPLAKNLSHLYQHLRQAGAVIQLDKIDRSCLDVSSRDVLRKIVSGDVTWEKDVPEKAAKVINRLGLMQQPTGKQS